MHTGKAVCSRNKLPYFIAITVNSTMRLELGVIIKDMFPCPECGKIFDDDTKLKSHRTVHGYRNEARKFVSTTYCLACMHEYHSFHKLEEHLLNIKRHANRGRNCWEVYQSSIQPLQGSALDDVAAIFLKEYRDAVADGVRVNNVALDVFPYHGPLIKGARRENHASL